MKIYAIYDVVSKRFAAPFLADNDSSCKRMVSNSLNSLPFVGDLDLYDLGSFDECNVDIGLKGYKPVFVCHCHSLKAYDTEEFLKEQEEIDDAT